jgi:hypothetical protein
MDELRPNPELKPHVDVHRRTTKVNIGTAAGVGLFLIITFFVVYFIARDPSPTVEQQHTKSERP